MQNKDSIYANQMDKVSSFVFDEKVAGVFNDMINRSVPGYAAIITMLGYLAEEYAQEGSNCYDLGCSLGASSLSMRKAIEKENKQNIHIISVDSSPAMIKRAKANIAKYNSYIPIDLRCADIDDVKIENASVSVLNFTLQFFKPQKRLDLLKRIFAGTKKGGILVLSEKVHFTDTNEQNFQTDMHHEFKRLNGYSDLEISQKRSALEDVLVSDTIQLHHERLKEAGFSSSYLWFQTFNFISIVAFKND